MMLNLNSTIYPHLGKEILIEGEKLDAAENVMLMIHGRGASAQSMIEFSQEFSNDKTTFIAPQAENMTWYPYRFIAERDYNEPDISSGLKLIESIIDSLNDLNIASDKIYLLGFSQGACLALDYAARNPKRFAGIFGLSGGLIGSSINFDDYSGNLANTPVFLGCSDNDPHIPEIRVHETEKVFKNLNGNVEKRIYKDLGHTVNQDEIDFVNEIINHQLKTVD